METRVKVASLMLGKRRGGCGKKRAAKGRWLSPPVKINRLLRHEHQA
jgi:hypothetical protein